MPWIQNVSMYSVLNGLHFFEPHKTVCIRIQDFGNTSSASIPLLMTSSLQSELSSQRCQLSLFGFGVGFSWAAANLQVGPLACVETIVR